MWRLARLLAVGAVLALLAVLVWDLVHEGSGSRFVDKIARGGKPSAPAFALPVLWEHDETWPDALRPRLHDGRLTLAELRGYPTVINFWASWCVPCKHEAPAFAAAARRYKGRVVFLGIDNQDFTGPARNFLARYKVNYVSVRDGTDRTLTRYGLTGLPETYYLDPRGRAVDHAVGAVSRRELIQGAERLLKESQ